jgi:DNA repair exonuclease SbcCD ATPase subunit
VLDGFDQAFDPGLNILIGGRGTGKSSVIELIRFCLGATSYTESGQQQSTEHALGVLGDGRVIVTLTDGRRQIEISRTAQDDEPDAAIAFDAPFVFSQSEIETIGLHAQSRLRLIDDFLGADLSPKRANESLASKVRSITSEIRTVLAEIDDVAEKTAELPKLQEQLDATKSQSAAQRGVSKEIEEHRGALLALTPQLAAARVRSEAISRITTRLLEWSERLESVIEQRPTMEPWPTQTGTSDELLDLRKKEKQAFSHLMTGMEELQQITAELQKKRAVSSSQRTGLENRAREIRQKIEDKQKGASALDKRIGELTQQISVLKSLLELRKERRLRLRQLDLNRAKLLDLISTARQELTNHREEVATRLSKDLRPAIRVTIAPYSQYREYVSKLSAALRGSGLRYNELSDRIAQVFTPQEIAALAETRNLEAVTSSLEITADRALRLCDALRGDAGSALFTTSVEDDVQIELKDGKDYKTIDFLSMGQRCTAILPIILRHTERIIILDQPEDHLDNAFVVGTLVKAILSRSPETQTIIATHNPNIPVLGDAGNVIYLDSDGTRCFVRVSGSIDTPGIVEAITTIMEGGRDAFQRRAAFYSKNLI